MSVLEKHANHVQKCPWWKHESEKTIFWRHLLSNNIWFRNY